MKFLFLFLLMLVTTMFVGCKTSATIALGEFATMQPPIVDMSSAVLVDHRCTPDFDRRAIPPIAPSNAVPIYEYPKITPNKTPPGRNKPLLNFPWFKRS